VAPIGAIVAWWLSQQRLTAKPWLEVGAIGEVPGTGASSLPACKLGLEGIVSKRKDSAYRSGRSPDWLKMKNSGGLGKRAVTELERKHLAETERHIAECEAYIAKQRDLIERAIQEGRSTEVAEATLESLEASLRAFERQRRFLLDRLKSGT
jgi:hypothetical protein